MCCCIDPDTPSLVSGSIDRTPALPCVAAVTVLMCGAATHAVYLAAAPESLRVPIAVRNAVLWKVRVCV